MAVNQLKETQQKYITELMNAEHNQEELQS